MLFLVRFTDRPDRGAVRTQYMDAHVAWLDANAARVPVAGALRETPDGPVVASVWIVRGSSIDDVLALVDGDPFWRNGLRATREVLHYKAHSALLSQAGMLE